MIKSLFDLTKELIFNFFLHIEVNTLNLEYTRQLKRPRRANLVSRALRIPFEKYSVRRVFGAQLAAAMLFAPLLGVREPQVNYETPINIPENYLVSAPDTEISLTTKDREFVLPVERLRYVGQYFRAGHLGYDLNSYVGDDVYAFSGGRVSLVESGIFGLGRYIVLDHGLGLISVYAHLQSFDVHIGQMVQTGQKIGEVGMTGNTTGPHLHFEVHDNGRAVNPARYLKLK